MIDIFGLDTDKDYTDLEISEAVLAKMDEAIRYDREKLFAVADSMQVQPKYQPYLADLEALKQTFRDLPTQPDYPNLNWPMPLPDFFPKVSFINRWKKDELILKKKEVYRISTEFDTTKNGSVAEVQNMEKLKQGEQI